MSGAPAGPQPPDPDAGAGAGGGSGGDAGPGEPQDPADLELIPRRPGEPAWMRLIGPLRSENAAFHAVLWAAGAAVALAVVVLLVRAVS